MVTTLERTETRALDEVVYRADLYPRDAHKPDLARQYAECLEMLPPIKINQHNELLDGYHRWTAHKIAKAARIAVEVVETTSDQHALLLANEFNSTHGDQLSRDEKKRNAVKLYTGSNKKELARTFSVTERTVSSWVEDIDRTHKEEQRRRIRDLWLSCHTQAEIAEAVDMPKRTVADAIEECAKLEAFPKSHILASRFDDLDWRPKLYSVWKFENPAESKREIIDQLLYMYTEPFDIVVDPTDQSGETIDVCKRRLRRYYASDTRPVVERSDVRTLNIGDGPPPLHKRWADVSLAYLHHDFTAEISTTAEYLRALAAKMRAGSHVACMVDFPQCFETDGAIDLVRAMCGSPTRQTMRITSVLSENRYTDEQVQWALEHRELLNIFSELIVWEVSTEQHDMSTI